MESFLVATDPYANAATRTIEGDDLGIYYDLDTNLGSFKLSINHSETDKFTQEPTATYAKLAAAQESGIIPFNVTLSGFWRSSSSRWKLCEKDKHETQL